MTDFEFQIDNFMLYCTSKDLSRKTLGSYEQTLKLFAAYLQNEYGIEEVSKVKSGHIRQYIKYLRERGKYTVVGREESKKVNHPYNRGDYGKTISATTIANYLRNIKVFFNYLHKVEREIPKNPTEGIANIKPERKVKKTLTEDEIRAVLKQFNTTTYHGYRNYVITKLLLDTGMRVGECLSLYPEDVDIRYRSIHVKRDTKSNKERYVYFSHKFALELKSWFRYRDRYTSSPYLFPTTRGTRLEVRNYERALRQAGERANVQIAPHQLRNNFAKYYILNNGDWFSLCRILGHSSVEVTQQAYLDFTDDEIGKKYQKHSPIAHMDI